MLIGYGVFCEEKGVFQYVLCDLCCYFVLWVWTYDWLVLEVLALN